MPRYHGITDEMIIRKHVDGCSYKEMVAFSGLTDRAIRNILTKYGIKLRKQYAGQPRKHKVNEHFFKTWTHEMAWVFGFLITNGHVTETNYLIAISQKHDDILKVIASYMEAEPIIKYNNNRVPSLLINSKIMQQDLANMGVTNNKTFDMPFPHVPKTYLPSFMRGMIEGNSWVQKDGSKIRITTCSPSLADGIKSIFTDWGLSSEITTKATKKGSVSYRVWVKGKEEVRKLSEIVYVISSIDSAYFQDKRDRMLQSSHCV